MPKIMTVLVAIGVASAGSFANADCPPPTEAQCYENPADQASWFWTDCGYAELQAMAVDPDSACNQIIYARSELERPGLAEEGLAAVPTGMPVSGEWVRERDYIAPAVIGTYDETLDPVAVLGASSSYTGTWQRLKSRLLGGGINPAILDPILERQQWADNASQVESCEEYVYERYYDYSIYEDDTAVLGTDYRAMYADGIALLADGVQSRTNVTTVEMPVPPARSPKNVFFTYTPIYPAGVPDSWKHAFADPDLVARMDRGKQVYRHTLAWHQNMDAALTAQYGDQLLYALAQKQRDFIKLLEERAAVYARWTKYDAAMRTANKACDGTFTPPNFSFFRPWEEIWNPSDRIYGWNLTHVYVRDAYDGLGIETPSQVASMAPGFDEGLFDSPALDYGVRAIDIGNRLALMAGDPLALDAAVIMSETTPEEMAGTGVPPAEEPPADECAGYTAPDGLPSVGSNLSCTGFVRLAGCADTARAQVSAVLAQIDARIEQALLEVEPYGCIALGDTIDLTPLDNGGVAEGSTPSPCDWNPELFVREMANHFVAERERDLRACNEATGGWFAESTHPIHNAAAPFAGEAIATNERAERAQVSRPVKNDYSGSTEDVYEFIKLVQDWAMSMQFQRDPRTGKPIPGHSAGDGDTLGNSMFGIDYSYQAEWKLQNLPSPTQSWSDSAACTVDLYAQAGAKASATIFGFGIDLFDGFARIENKPGAGNTRRANRTLRLDILGADILVPLGISKEASGTAETGTPIEFHVAQEVSKEQEVASMTFPIAGVPVTVRAGFAGRIGFELEANVALSAGCPSVSTSIGGKLVPAASLDAYVSGGVDLAIVEIGLQIDLTLIRLALPFQLSFKLAPYRSGAYFPNDVHGYGEGIPMIHANPKLSLSLTTLSGRLRAYLRFPIGSPMYVTLFAWPGVELAETVLFEPKWSFSLARVVLGMQLLGGH